MTDVFADATVTVPCFQSDLPEGGGYRGLHTTERNALMGEKPPGSSSTNTRWIRGR